MPSVDIEELNPICFHFGVLRLNSIAVLLACLFTSTLAI